MGGRLETDLDRNPPRSSTPIPRLRSPLVVFSVTGEGSKPATDRNPPPILCLRSRLLFFSMTEEGSNPPPRTTTFSLLRVSPPSSLVFSKHRNPPLIIRLLSFNPPSSLVSPSEEGAKPSKDDDCLAPHGVSSVASRLLRQKNDANPFGRRVSRHRLVAYFDKETQLETVVETLLVYVCRETRKLTRCHEKPNKSSHEIKSSHEMQVTRCIRAREYTRWKSQELYGCQVKQ
ncbi:LOW QUALITY PROTEIN: hypothetical protein HID58_083948 [Brassica napus]|uniref:Uncharacterized protein n=1 Tax=Brassica napus TaxID=3708 RepID=A0ABQ7XEB4_BRANA|nr:LOW QUALITY PROTEIN: hypothetical protein HID58_083948 [Brassica napus]